MEAEFEDEKRRNKGKKYILKPHFKADVDRLTTGLTTEYWEIDDPFAFPSRFTL